MLSIVAIVAIVLSAIGAATDYRKPCGL